LVAFSQRILWNVCTYVSTYVCQRVVAWSSNLPLKRYLVFNFREPLIVRRHYKRFLRNSFVWKRMQSRFLCTYVWRLRSEQLFNCIFLSSHCQQLETWIRKSGFRWKQQLGSRRKKRSWRYIRRSVRTKKVTKNRDIPNCPTFSRWKKIRNIFLNRKQWECLVNAKHWRRGIVVIASAYRTEDPGFESRQGVRFFRYLYIAVL
jgi:hypothetical protein